MKKYPLYGTPSLPGSSADKTGFSGGCTKTGFCKSSRPALHQFPGKLPSSSQAHGQPVHIPAQADLKDHKPCLPFPSAPPCFLDALYIILIPLPFLSKNMCPVDRAYPYLKAYYFSLYFIHHPFTTLRQPQEC